MWNELTEITESKNLNTELLRDFYDKDPQLIKEVKTFILERLKQLLEASFKENKHKADEDYDVR